MTPDQWIFLIGGVGVAWWLARTFVARPAPVPAAQSPPHVRARVVDDHPASPPSLDQLMAQMNQAVDTQGTALAYSRKAAQMIEARAAAVDFPLFAAPPPPKPDPPKS